MISVYSENGKDINIVIGFAKPSFFTTKPRKCMSEKVAKFVAKEFDAGCGSGLGSYGIYGRQRISVIFKIDTLGRATEIRARAAHLKLEREAIRVINMLPVMKPGTQDGKKVIVPYSLPIVFQVGD